MLAVKNRNLKRARQLIRRGADANFENDDGDSSPLIEAMKRCDAKMMHFLIHAGAHSNARIHYGSICSATTLLHWACSKDIFFNIAKLLVENGADVNAQNLWGETPLHEAAKTGNNETIQFLIDNGSDINAQNLYNQYTPLHEAILKKRIDTVTFLIEQGADLTMSDDNGDTPFHLAVEASTDIGKLIIQRGVNLNARGVFGYTPLIKAVSEGKIDMVTFLIEQGADVTVCADNGNTPLHIAALRKSIVIVRVLLKLSKKNSTQGELPAMEVLH